MTDVRMVAIGLTLLVVAAIVVLWRGGPLERQVAISGAACWIAAAIGQMVSHLAVLPIVLADLAFAACLLFFVLRHHRGWLYGLVALQAARLILHGLVFEGRLEPTPIYRLVNNSLSTVGLVILVAAALSYRRPTAAAAQS